MNTKRVESCCPQPSGLQQQLDVYELCKPETLAELNHKKLCCINAVSEFKNRMNKYSHISLYSTVGKNFAPFKAVYYQICWSFTVF